MHKKSISIYILLIISISLIVIIFFLRNDINNIKEELLNKENEVINLEKQLTFFNFSCKDSTKEDISVCASEEKERVGELTNKLKDFFKEQYDFKLFWSINAGDTITDNVEYMDPTFTNEEDRVSSSFAYVLDGKINDITNLEVNLLIDKTGVNGYYVTTFQSNESNEVSIYKYKNLFVIFNETVDKTGLTQSEIIENGIEISEIKKQIFSFIKENY